MQSPIELIPHYAQNPHLLAAFLDAAVKSVVVLVMAGALCQACRRASAAARHLIWFLALASLPFLVVLSAKLPPWQSPPWVVSAGIDSGNQVSFALGHVHSPSGAAPAGLPAPNTGAPSLTSPGVRSGTTYHPAVHFDARWLSLGFMVYCGGALLVVTGVIAGQMRLRAMRRNWHPPQGAEWPALLQKLRGQLRIRRSVILLEADNNLMPATWGWWRPAVLLPAGAEAWPSERRRVVLLHELAHVKRWDCLTQLVTGLVCSLVWFNPLVWFAARRMCVERERACDDLVVNAGVESLDYAGHLVELARTLRRLPHVAAIAMARSPLEGRIAALVDKSLARRLSPASLVAVLLFVSTVVFGVAGWQTNAAVSAADDSELLRQQQLVRLQAFSAAKFGQSKAMAAAAGEEILPPYRILFDAATKGDWRMVTNQYVYFKEHHPQYGRGGTNTEWLRTSYWQPALEVCLAFSEVAEGEPKYVQMAIDGLMNAVPAGSIYFGGTDPGRGLPTAFSQSHAEASPFFTLTQNALADNSYLKYLRDMYGAKIYTPSEADSHKCFDEYLQDAVRRLDHDLRIPPGSGEPRLLKPGEEVRRVVDEDGQTRVQVTGQVAVMAINGLLTKVIFDHNLDKEFYIEESFPLDWMYPYLSPGGLILKLNRQPLAELSDEAIRKDREYWAGLTQPMIGDWLDDNTTVQQVVSFAGKRYGSRDLTGFTGDPRFIRSELAQRFFSKQRSSLAGVYAWRMNHSNSETEKARMAREADFAYRQAFALCPYSQDVVERLAEFLVNQDRRAEAKLVTEEALREMKILHPKDDLQATKARLEGLLNSPKKTGNPDSGPRN